MTRIVAGVAGGRRLQVPNVGTRPTAERVREAMFNALDSAGELADARVLDLYAGSGALGLEALSRGARDAVFVESDRNAVRLLRANIEAVGLGGSVRNAQAENVLALPSPAAFDLVFADPPYRVGGSELVRNLTALSVGAWLAEGALVLIERAARSAAPDWPASFRVLEVRTYGDTTLHRAEYLG